MNRPDPPPPLEPASSPSSLAFQQRIHRARAGDPVAKKALIEAAWTDAHARATKAARQRPDLVDDPSGLAQDVTLRVVRKLDTFQGTRRRPFFAWVRTIFQRELAGLPTRPVLPPAAFPAPQGSDSRIPDGPIAPGPGLSTILDREDLRRRLLQAVDALEPKLRSVIHLRYVEHLGYAEIAERLACTPEAARKRHQRALKVLLGLFRKPAGLPSN